MSYSQRTAKVSATYTYYAPETMSVEETKRIALDRAKIQAIADEFGTIVSQSTSTIVTNKNGESDTQFFALGGSDVKGEWIETIGNPEFHISYADNTLIVKCIVKGKAREISQAVVEFTAIPLRNGTERRYESSSFKDGDDLFLYFKAAIDGYLSVYLLEEAAKTVYNILPYKSQHISAVPVEANKEYVFFSRSNAPKSERGFVDEYSLSCEGDKEFHTLYILFSPTEIGKRTGFDDSIDEIPNHIGYNEFKQWFGKTLSRNSSLQFIEKTITISK